MERLELSRSEQLRDIQATYSKKGSLSKPRMLENRWFSSGGMLAPAIGCKDGDSKSPYNQLP